MRGVRGVCLSINMATQLSRLQVLQMIEDGKITADEGLHLLEKIAEQETVAAEDPIIAQPASGPILENVLPGGSAKNESSSFDPKLNYWRRWWLIPFFIGLGFTALVALALYGLATLWGPVWASVCMAVPLLIGLGITVLAFVSRKARWIHVRVDTGQTEWPRRISISLPVPLGFVAWLVRTFGWRIPAMQRTAIDDLLVALDDTKTVDAPIFVDVNEGSKGERVQVYIG